MNEFKRKRKILTIKKPRDKKRKANVVIFKKDIKQKNVQIKEIRLT
jgi:hypothetical protein